MPETAFISYAPNGEDVVIWRALGALTQGRVLVLASGGGDPTALTRALTERGWAATHRDAAGAPDLDDVDVLIVDESVAGVELIGSLDLTRHRPRVVVIGAVEPAEQVLAAGYRACLFDGISRYYVADEHAAELGEALSYPACPRDDFTPYAVVHWREAALADWARTVETAPTTRDVQKLRRELKAMRRSTSWRVTKPLRRLTRMARKVTRR